MSLIRLYHKGSHFHAPYAQHNSSSVRSLVRCRCTFTIFCRSRERMQLGSILVEDEHIPYVGSGPLRQGGTIYADNTGSLQ